MPTHRYAAINISNVDVTTTSTTLSVQGQFWRNNLVPEMGHLIHPKTGQNIPFWLAVSPLPAVETISHEKRDDRLPVHNFSAIDHTQSL